MTLYRFRLSRPANLNLRHFRTVAFKLLPLVFPAVAIKVHPLGKEHRQADQRSLILKRQPTQKPRGPAGS
jgi:hypothetical protein